MVSEAVCDYMERLIRGVGQRRGEVCGCGITKDGEPELRRKIRWHGGGQLSRYGGTTAGRTSGLHFSALIALDAVTVAVDSRSVQI